jgi:hypothetical protein
MNMKFEIGGYKFNISLNVGKVESDEMPGQIDCIPVVSESSNEMLEEQIQQDSINHYFKITENQEEPLEVNILDKKTIIATKEVEDKKEEVIHSNGAYQKLIEECTDLISEFESYKTRFETEEGKMMTDIAQERLFEILAKSGAQLITDETSFDIIRHIAIPAKVVENGTPVLETIRPGIALGSKVLIRAQVRI